MTRQACFRRRFHSAHPLGMPCLFACQEWKTADTTGIMKTHLNTPKTLSRFLPLVIFMSICGSSVLSLFAPRLDAQQYLASPVSLAGPTGLTVVRSGEYNNVVSWHAVPGATAPAAPCALAQANFQAAGVTLTARGVHYWLVVTTSGAATQTGTT